MRLPLVSAVLALGANLAAAIEFTNPAANATLTKGSTFDLTWTSVDTDPTSFSVYLVNFVNWPPYYEQLSLDLETSAGEASVRIPCDADSSYGFQFNAINGTNVYVIYAQTSKFFVSGDSCTDPITTSPVSTCAAASTATATVTVTVRGNSSFPSTTSAATALVSSGAAAVVVPSTYQGECPSTIGWNGNYSNPVTLTQVPHADSGVGSGYTAYLPTATSVATATGGASTLLAVPTAGSKAATGEKKCTKKRQVRKRHSDGGRPAPFPRKK